MSQAAIIIPQCISRCLLSELLSRPPCTRRLPPLVPPSLLIHREMQRAPPQVRMIEDPNREPWNLAHRSSGSIAAGAGASIVRRVLFAAPVVFCLFSYCVSSTLTVFCNQERGDAIRVDPFSGKKGLVCKRECVVNPCVRVSGLVAAEKPH